MNALDHQRLTVAAPTMLERFECESLGTFHISDDQCIHMETLNKAMALLARYKGEKPFKPYVPHRTRLSPSTALFVLDSAENLDLFGLDRPDWRIWRMGGALKAMLGDFTGKYFSQIDNPSIVARCCTLIKVARDTGRLIHSESVYTDPEAGRFQFRTKYMDLSAHCGQLQLVGCHADIRPLL